MKRSFITLLTCFTIFSTLHAQDEWYLGVNYVAWVADASGKVFRNTPVTATIGYKDSEGTVLYREGHTGVTNTLGNVGFQVGLGSQIEGILTLESFREIASFCYDITVDNNGEEFHIVGEKPVSSAPRANAAGWALSSKSARSLGDVCWDDDVVPINELLNPINGINYQFPHVRDEGSRELKRTFVSTSLTDLIRSRVAPEVNPDGEDIPYLNIGTGIGRPMYCGPDPEYIRAMHAIRMATIANLTYGTEVTIDNYDADHSTWAILGQNGNSMGGGILAYGPGNIGSLNIGRGGAQAQGVGSGNTYGVYGLNPNAALTGENKVGVIAYDGGHSTNYAMQTTGMVFHSHAPVVGSDGRWKREIKGESVNIISSINKLRPATYLFVENSPYSHPKVLQHGFIAQELEMVFPELVTDVVLPTTYDPDLILNCDTETYKAIQYSGLISILTAGIQELDATVQTQQEEISTLKEMVRELSRQMADLKN